MVFQAAKGLTGQNSGFQRGKNYASLRRIFNIMNKESIAIIPASEKGLITLDPSSRLASWRLLAEHCD